MPEEIKIPASKAKAETPRGPRPASKRTQLHEDITSLYANLGMMAFGLGLTIDDAGIAGVGAAMTERSGQAADAWMDLADKNPKIKAALERLTEAGTMGGLLAVHVAIAMPFLASREMVPAFIASKFTPRAPDAADQD